MKTIIRVGIFVCLVATLGLSGCGFTFDSPDDTPACQGSQTECGWTCVDTSSSETHCGACGVECAADESCIEGSCTAPEPCQPGECAAGEFCSEDSERCEEGCQTDAQCGAEQFCDTSTNACQCSDGLEVCGDGLCCERIDGRTRVSEARDYSTLDLALDTADRAHIVTQPIYSQDIIYLVEDDEDGFDAHTVFAPRSPDAIPGGQTIDVDPTGTAHIAFLEREGETATLYHAWGVDEDWSTEAVDQLEGGYAIPSIVAPTADAVHLAYRNIRPELAYYEFESNTWNKSSILRDNVLGAPQLALDRQDVIRMAFWDADGEVMRVIEPPDFSTGQPFESGILLRAPSLAYDSQNQPHIAFGDASTLELKYTSYDGDIWTQEVISHVREGSDPRMVLDSEDSPHIIFVREDSTQVLYAWRDSDGWNRRVVGTTVEGESFSSERWVDIAMADGDVPVLAYAQANGRISVIRVGE